MNYLSWTLPPIWAVPVHLHMNLCLLPARPGYMADGANNIVYNVLGYGYISLPLPPPSQTAWQRVCAKKTLSCIRTTSTSMDRRLICSNINKILAAEPCIVHTYYALIGAYNVQCTQLWNVHKKAKKPTFVKGEIFITEFFTPTDPMWVGDLGNGPKNNFL